MPKKTTKRCGKCGKVKASDDFHKSRSSKDGLGHVCKECYKAYYKDHKQHLKSTHKKRSDVDSQNSRAGIDSWQQVDSVLREMAESQLVINHENTALEERINLIKSYSNEIIEPPLSHQMVLQTMLIMFLKKELLKTKNTTRKFPFGKIFWSNGKVKIKLNTELAKNRMGKP